MNTYSWWQWMMFFFFYSFLGWIWESCYVSVHEKRWVNRGFLHLPLLPLYGSGACVVLFATMPFQDNLILLYLSGMVGASLLECGTGLAMEALYKVKYWDYSDCFLNFKGVICLKASLLWGVFSVAMVKVVHLPIARLLDQIPVSVVWTVEAVVGVAFVYDFYISNRDALQLAHLLTAMEKAKVEMQENLDRMEKELAEQREILEARLADAREHAEEQIADRIQAALDRMDTAKQSMGTLYRNMNELRGDMMESVAQAADTVKDGVTTAAGTVKEGMTSAAGTVKDGVTTAAGTVKDGMTTAAGTVKDGMTSAAETVKDGVTSAAAHNMEAVRLNMIFHSDALMNQMRNTRETYSQKQTEMMARAESLSRSMLLRNPTAKVFRKVELTAELRQRARRWMEFKNKKIG